MNERLAELNSKCFGWNTPDRLRDVVDALADLLGDNAMLRQGRTFREAFVAARFAARRGASRVRLLRESSTTTMPDFEIELGGSAYRYETTEADIPGRRRQDEYRRPRKVEPMIFTNLEVMVDRMREIARNKANKSYDRCHGLVIWVNPPVFAFEPKMRWANLLRGGEPAALAFPEVWAMRGDGALLWLDGVAQAEIPGEEF